MLTLRMGLKLYFVLLYLESKIRQKKTKKRLDSSPLSSMEFMESSLGRKCVPMRSDMEWAAESLCVPARSGRLTLASGWGCGSETEACRLGSGSHTAERGRMAEDVSLMPLSCLRPFILSFSLEKGERGFSFMERSNMLAVMLFLMNWMLTWMRPRSFFFFPGLDSKGYQLQRERRGTQGVELQRGNLCKESRRGGKFPNLITEHLTQCKFTLSTHKKKLTMG